MTENKVFKSSMAERISKTDPKFQYQGSLISTWMMLLGIIAFMIYIAFFGTMTGWLKGISLFNMFFMGLFMYAQLVTTYQQYRSYKEAKLIQDEITKVMEAQQEIKNSINKDPKVMFTIDDQNNERRNKK